ncbi:hypothetical protein B0H11DRAFT_2263144 [Mycena galericulata]|nr:hypothetical protein B0H11DRAFT_2263144 [Mycena galericulata]
MPFLKFKNEASFLQDLWLAFLVIQDQAQYPGTSEEERWNTDSHKAKACAVENSITALATA